MQFMIFCFIAPFYRTKYDHFIFPGAVPRSFIGALVLSAITAPLELLLRSFHLLQSKAELQFLVRLVLATINAYGLSRLCRAANKTYGSTVAWMFILITCTQFHLPFWMSRTLPNMFALFPVNLASTCLMSPPSKRKPFGYRNQFNKAISLLVFAAVTLRFELALLIAPLALQGLLLGKTTLRSIILTGLKSGMFALITTVLLDSFMWQKWPLWPELAGQYFNVYQGKSAEWGTSPSYSYFTLHLPKLLLSALPLSIIGFCTDVRTRSLLFPYILFVGLLSLHGHKEWRFVIYVVPVWNIVAARGAAWLISAPSKNKFVSKVFLLGCFGLNIAMSIFLTQASMANYPGGEALRRFNSIMEHSNSTGLTSVHIDNLAAQTGASLFLHEFAPPRSRFPPIERQVLYDKTENLSTVQQYSDFGWVITERPDVFTTRAEKGRWEPREVVNGLQSIQLISLGDKGVWKLLRVPRVVTRPKLWIFQRKGS